MANSVAIVNSFSLFQHSLLFLCFIKLPILSLCSGFTVDLVHHDSPLSPLYDATKTISDRVKQAFHISNSRAAYFREASSKSTRNFEAQILSGGTGYIALLSVGKPPTPFYGHIDTGSSLTWTKCLPCLECDNQTAPLFDPNQSSTFNFLNCSSPFCKGPDFSCSQTDPKKCNYEVFYGDNSFTKGYVSEETFTFGSTSIPDLLFGCGHNQEGKFLNSSNGLIGLGGANISFPSQLKKSINGKFSYCFVDSKSKAKGKISFGDDSVVSGEGVVTTPLVPRNGSTYYRLTLDSVKIGKTKIKNPELEDGNIVIDSGTTITYLPEDMVSSIGGALRRDIKGTTVRDPEGVFDLCYNSSSTKFDGEPINFEFKGAELAVPQSSAFIDIGTGVSCLGILMAGGISILGNMLQVNFQVGYDLVGKTVSFKQTDCSKR